MIKKTKLTAALLTAAMVLQLAACGSNTASGTENTSDNGATAAIETAAASESAESVDTETAATEDTGTHTVVDHAGNTVEVPNHITRVVIDQIPILSTYMSYFGGEAPYIVGYCGSFKDTISKTVLKNISPELMESADTVYAQSDLNIEEIMKLEPDVILYNAGNTAHAEILQESGIPCIGFATVGHETEADPLNRYKQWLDLLEDVFGEEGKTDAFTAAGDEIVADVEARIAAVPEDERPSALILWKYSDGVPQVSGNGTFGTYWMKHLGVTDVAAEATGFTQVSMEQIYGWNPDILFVDGPGLIGLTSEDVLENKVEGPISPPSKLFRTDVSMTQRSACGTGLHQTRTLRWYSHGLHATLTRKFSQTILWRIPSVNITMTGMATMLPMRKWRKCFSTDE